MINTGNLKSDYDKKYISVEFSSGLEAGDTFEILDDGTHWMIYLPILTETAYLRSEIIRCRYQLEIDGSLYWIYFQGPTETDLRWFLKNQININELNLKSKVKKVGLTEKQSEKYEYSHELIICDKNNNDLKTAYVGSDYDSDIEEYEGWDSILEFAEGNSRADKIYIYDNGNLETVVWTRKFGTSERFDSLEEANEAE